MSMQRCGSTHGHVKAGGKPSCSAAGRLALYVMCRWHGGPSYSNCLPRPLGAGCMLGLAMRLCMSSAAALWLRSRSGCSKRLSLLLGAQHHTR